VHSEEERKEPLKAEVDHIVMESRMALPRVQTLIRFQMIAVFDPRFEQALPMTG
jgi:hypothetical protein